MYYRQLLGLNILHEFYQNKVCSDLSIEPTAECRKILSGHRLTLKNKSNGIEIIAPVDSAKKLFVELRKALKLTFTLSIANLSFIDFTELNFTPLDCCVLFRNEKAAQNTKQTLKLNAIKREKLHLPNSKKIFGLIEIYLKPVKRLEKAAAYDIIFKSKKQKWYYYLVTDSKSDRDDLLITDRESNREPKIEFKPTKIESNNKLVNSIVRQFPNSKQYLFTSETEITCQELSIKNIQLAKKAENGTPIMWIEHLPNPPNSTGIQIINTLKIF